MLYNSKKLKYVSTYTHNPMDPTEEDLKNYFSQLSEQEQLVFEIAKTHLETSFDLVKTIGFIEWFKQQPRPVELIKPDS